MNAPTAALAYNLGALFFYASIVGYEYYGVYGSVPGLTLYIVGFIYVFGTEFSTESGELQR